MRDIRIDILRGYAMLTIAVNHVSFLFVELGLNRRPIPTLTSFGFSSAAEIFFLLSGYMVGMVYVRKADCRKRLWARAFEIYRYNVGAFLAAMFVIWIFGEPLSSAAAAQPTLDDPLMQTIRFLVLMQHPDLLGVLALYVLFMLAAPVVIWLARTSFAACAAASLILYCLAQWLPAFNLIGGTPGDDRLWNFNPAAWQLIFFGGMVAGYFRVHEALFRLLEASRWRPFVVLLVLAVTIVLHQTSLRAAIPAMLYDKQDLGPLRIVHALLVVAALSSVLTIVRPYLAHPLARTMALSGRRTLDCYTASIPVTFALGGLWVAGGRPYAGYFAACATIVGVIVAVAWLGERRRKPGAAQFGQGSVSQPGEPRATG